MSTPETVAVPPAWPEITPPSPPRIDTVITQVGRQRNDPYAWMKFIPGKGSRTVDALPAPVNELLLAEMAYADAMLSPLDEAVAGFAERMHQLAGEVAEPAPWRPEGYHYGRRLPEGGTRPIFFRTAPDGSEELLFDEAERAQGHDYYRATDHQHSPDHRYYAWAEDVIGDDRHRICLLDTTDGTISVAVAADAFGYGGLTFSASSCHLFWIWRDAHSRPSRLYRTALADHVTTLVQEEQDPAFFMQVARTGGGSFVALTLAGADTSEVRLIPAGGEVLAPKLVRPREPGVRYWVDEWRGALVMLTEADGAINRKLVSLDRTSFAPIEELVPYREHVSIIKLAPFADALLRLEREECQTRLVLRRPDGRETIIAFDDPAYAIALAPDQDYRSHRVRIVHQTPISPPRWIDLDLTSGEQRTVGQATLHAFDPDDYRVERLFATAPDGAQVPITLLSRRDMDGRATPLLLNGYGSYGYSREPDFMLPVIALVDAGFRYAIAHVRGGAERGQGWFLDGRREKKRNSMTDFIACAHHLVGSGHAVPGQIVSHGISAGGLLVAGAMNMAPELWAGVIAQVPFVDMLNTMSDADHPLVPLFRPDWGDPLADPDAYDWIAAISPYENVGERRYPPLLCTAGLKDDRVPYWEPAKLIAAIRHAAGGDSPAILRLDPESGHQMSGDRESEFEQASLLWAFAQHCVAARSAA